MMAGIAQTGYKSFNFIAVPKKEEKREMTKL